MENRYKLIFLCFILLIISQSAWAQFTVTGTIIDASTNEPLISANIFHQPTGSGTTTNTDGEFTIELPGQSTTLRISFIGYISQNVEVSTSNNNINLALKPDVANLEELVVTGLASSVKRENLANAVSSVSAEELTGKSSHPTVGEALQGKVPGANLTSTGGAPGGGIDIKLRGISTLGAGSSQPLIIIDGIYVNNQELQTGLSAVSNQADPEQDDVANRLADLNPEDIETIEILKGPSAAAIYGARANAGVVIIKTKTGKAGKTEVSFRQDIGFSTPLNLRGSSSWDEEKIDLVFGEGTALAVLSRQLLQEAEQNNTLRDYEDIIYDNRGAIANTQIGVSGGDEKTQFFVSGAFKDENGIIERTGFNRVALRANIDHQLTDNIKIASKSNYINSESERGFTGNGGVGSVGQAIVFTPPFAQLFPDENGDFPDNPFFQQNPLEIIAFGQNNQSINRVIQSLNVDIELFRNGATSLNLNSIGGVDFLNSTTLVSMPPFFQFQQTQPNPGDVINTADRVLNFNLQSVLIFNTELGSDTGLFNLTSQVGATRFENNRELQQIRGRGLVPGQINILNATLQEVFNQTFIDITDLGIFGQQEINWQDKLIGTVGGRLDRSTLNEDQNRFYFFPKASLAANIANFDFWEVEFIDQLKLRVAYGETGGLPNFGVTFESLNPNVISGNLGTVRSVRSIDPDLQPETAQELELGFDIGLGGGRAFLEATYYEKTVRDLILDQELPASVGIQVIATNAADLRNRGVELSLNLIPIQNSNVTWNTTVNWFTNESKITDLQVPAFTTGAFGSALGTFLIEEGFAPTTIVGTPFNAEEGRFTVYGDSQPDFQLTLANSFNFLKNWELNFLWHWSQGQQAINLTRFLSDNGGTTADFNDDDDGDGIPNGRDREGVGAQRFIEDASFVKLRELSVYYSFPKSFLENVTQNAVKKIRLGISGNNLLLFTPYNSFDPEVSEFGNSAIATGVEVAPFPSARQLFLKIEFDF